MGSPLGIPGPALAARPQEKCTARGTLVFRPRNRGVFRPRNRGVFRIRNTRVPNPEPYALLYLLPFLSSLSLSLPFLSSLGSGELSE